MSRNLPNWIDAYLEYTKETEPPTLFKKWMAISTVAAALQRKCYVRLGTDLTFYPNMYIVLVGPTGARKSTAMVTSRRLLSELEIPLVAEYITREALIRRIAKSEDTAFTPDMTEMRPHSSMTVHSSELTVFLGFNKPEFIRDLCDFYDCPGTWVYETKNMGTDKLRNVWFNLVGASTPDSLHSSLSAEAVGGGLASRILFIFADIKSGIFPITIETEENQEAFRALRKDLQEIHSLQGEFIVTRGFAGAYTEWCFETEEHPPFIDPRFHGYNDRRRTHLVKLSMILSAAHSNEQHLTIDEFNLALSLLEEAERFMPKALGGVGKSDVSALMYSVQVRIANEKKLRFSRLMRLHLSDTDEKELMLVVKSLERAGYCKIKRAKGQNDYDIEWKNPE